MLDDFAGDNCHLQNCRKRSRKLSHLCKVTWLLSAKLNSESPIQRSFLTFILGENVEISNVMRNPGFIWDCRKGSQSRSWAESEVPCPVHSRATRVTGTRGSHHSLGRTNYFHGKNKALATRKAGSRTEITDKLDFVGIKNFCFVKDTVRKRGRQTTNGEKRICKRTSDKGP